MPEDFDLSHTIFSFPDQPGGFHYSVRRWLPDANVSHAIITLDDELLGETMIGAVKTLTIGREIEPVAVYSVGFGTSSFAQLHVERGRRFTLVETDKLIPVGLTDTGAGHFLVDWLEHGLLPIIREDLPRLAGLPAIAGYSLSGLFALQCAILRPALCSKVAAISPSLFLEPLLAEGLESRLTDDSLHRIYLAAGRLEEDRTMTGLAEDLYQLVEGLGTALSEHKPNAVRTEIFDAHTHFSVPSAAAPSAVRHLFGERRS